MQENKIIFGTFKLLIQHLTSPLGNNNSKGTDSMISAYKSFSLKAPIPPRIVILFKK